MAALIATRPGLRTRLCFTTRLHRGEKANAKASPNATTSRCSTASTSSARPDHPGLDRLNTHVSAVMRELIAARAWLQVVLLPSYAPYLNPVEAVWSHVKRSLAT